MDALILNDEIVRKAKKDVANLVRYSMKTDLKKIIMYGSCARGDYTEDSDIDIALLTKCDRMEAKKYNDILAEIAAELAAKYFVIVNFVCLPYKEFNEKKEWYGYFKNIETEGEVLYG